MCLIWSRVPTVGTVVVSHFAGTAIESMTATSFTTLIAIDIGKQSFDVTATKRRIGGCATVDSCTVSIDLGRVLAVGISINETIGGIDASRAHRLVAFAASMTVIAIVSHDHTGQHG
jgi:hypothetical protein